MAIENSITFGGVNSADYGIYISGEGVFNAPKRDVKMITIPGRNGEFALDQGRFENITVTYPAFNFEPGDYSAFVQNLSDFRNAICSQKGYQRLTDTFHPDEYRMAAYIGGLEIKPIKYNTASQFSILFECKPQRFLTSGETAVTVASGDTITNPTLFESSPLLEVTGYGNININSEQITVQIIELGEIVLNRSSNKASVTLEDASLLNTGDSIFDKYNLPRFMLSYKKASGSAKNLSFADIQGTSGSVTSAWIQNKKITAELGSVAFVKGTSGTISGSVTVRFRFTDNTLVTGTMSATLTYDGNDKMTLSYTLSSFPETDLLFTPSYYHPAYDGDLSQSANPDPTYIDLDIGEVYGYINHTLTQLNNTVILPANLPELNPGANTITYSNTVTALKVIPRWWKI